MRIGSGYDVHRLVEGRDLILGGVKIPFEKGLLGHSDADVLTHAIMDALLGAAALGDIGRHFPDNDERYRGADSLKLLAHVGELLQQEHYLVGNIDATIVAQRPKLAPYLAQMEENIAGVLGIEKNQINIKATTEEHLGFTGAGEGMSAQAVALLQSAEDFMDAGKAGMVYAYDGAAASGCCAAGCSGCSAKQQ
ncbi:MAG: 2-C-methyl-D-erythritol 2,4-cyclodiphosphate synthase [Lachnospiraceae bacterium]|nr:2-C-methyl-D-erythritol 2,4-cyclodiphosphate synthase [Lachnospiraceae bacterium]